MSCRIVYILAIMVSANTDTVVDVASLDALAASSEEAATIMPAVFDVAPIAFPSIAAAALVDAGNNDAGKAQDNTDGEPVSKGIDAIAAMSTASSTTPSGNTGVPTQPPADSKETVDAGSGDVMTTTRGTIVPMDIVVGPMSDPQLKQRASSDKKAKIPGESGGNDR